MAAKPDPTNDHVVVYRDGVGEWRWRRVDSGNGETVAMGSEGYDSQAWALDSARAYCSDLDDVRVLDDATTPDG